MRAAHGRSASTRTSSTPVRATASEPAVDASPLLRERPDDVVETPRRGMLMRDVEDLVGDRRRVRKIVLPGKRPLCWRLQPSRPYAPALTEPRRIDGAVDCHIADMHALRPKVARQRL